MRIAWIVYGALDQITGGYLYDRLVIERLRTLGDTVHVASLDPNPQSRPLAALALTRRLTRLLPDIVVGDELCFREIACAFPFLPHRVTRVLLVHHLSAWELPPGLRRAAVGLAERAAALACHAHLATSETTAQRLRHEHGLGHVFIAPPGADRLPIAPRPPRGEDTIRLIFVGSLLPRKRILEFLTALDRVRHPRAALTIVGDPARDPTYAARVRRAIEGSTYLRARVTPLGLVDDAGLSAALAVADALVLPSSLEGYGMVLTEAVRAGVPVIAARAGAVPEVVRDGAEALLFDGEAELERALAAFLDDPALRARMRAAAEARAPHLPTWNTTAAAVRAALNQSPATRAARAPPPAAAR